MNIRILIEPSDYTFHNAGDQAMLQTSITRLTQLLPEASIHVFTDDPDNLSRYSSIVTPVTTSGRSSWLSDEFLLGSRPYPIRFAPKANRLDRAIRRHAPVLAEAMYRLR